MHGLAMGDLPASIKVKVEARIARLSYGVKFAARWDPEKHLQADKYWDTLDHGWRANNQMEWFLRKVACLKSTQPPWLHRVMLMR